MATISIVVHHPYPVFQWQAQPDSDPNGGWVPVAEAYPQVTGQGTTSITIPDESVAEGDEGYIRCLVGNPSSSLPLSVADQTVIESEYTYLSVGPLEWSLPLPAGTTTIQTTREPKVWWIRPDDATWENDGNGPVGESYGNAFRGPQWVPYGSPDDMADEKVCPGDTIMLRGRFENITIAPDGAHPPTEAKWDSINGLSDSRRTIYDGTASTDPGAPDYQDDAVINNFWLQGETWVEGDPGVYSFTWFNRPSMSTYWTMDNNNDGNGAYKQIVPVDTYELCRDTANSRYTNGDTEYVHLEDNGNPTGRVVWPYYGHRLKGAFGYDDVNGDIVKYQTVKGVSFLGPHGSNAGDTMYASYFTFENCNFTYGGYCFIAPRNYSDHFTVKGGEISWAQNGIYSNTLGSVDQSPANGAAYLTIDGVYVHDIGYPPEPEGKDMHCIGLQEGDNVVVKNCTLERGQSGITFYGDGVKSGFPGDPTNSEGHFHHTYTNNTIREMGYRGPEEDDYGNMGIELNTTQDWVQAFDCTISDNIVEDAKVGLRINIGSPDGAEFANDRIRVHNNDFLRCQQWGVQFAQAGDPGNTGIEIRSYPVFTDNTFSMVADGPESSDTRPYYGFYTGSSDTSLRGIESTGNTFISDAAGGEYLNGFNLPSLTSPGMVGRPGVADFAGWQGLGFDLTGTEQNAGGPPGPTIADPSEMYGFTYWLSSSAEDINASNNVTWDANGLASWTAFDARGGSTNGTILRNGDAGDLPTPIQPSVDPDTDMPVVRMGAYSAGDQYYNRVTATQNVLPSTHIFVFGPATATGDPNWPLGGATVMDYVQSSSCVSTAIGSDGKLFSRNTPIVEGTGVLMTVEAQQACVDNKTVWFIRYQDPEQTQDGYVDIYNLETKALIGSYGPFPSASSTTTARGYVPFISSGVAGSEYQADLLEIVSLTAGAIRTQNAAFVDWANSVWGAGESVEPIAPEGMTSFRYWLSCSANDVGDYENNDRITYSPTDGLDFWFVTAYTGTPSNTGNIGFNGSGQSPIRLSTDPVTSRNVLRMTDYSTATHGKRNRFPNAQPDFPSTYVFVLGKATGHGDEANPLGLSYFMNYVTISKSAETAINKEPGRIVSRNYVAYGDGLPFDQATQQAVMDNRTVWFIRYQSSHPAVPPEEASYVEVYNLDSGDLIFSADNFPSQSDIQTELGGFYLMMQSGVSATQYEADILEIVCLYAGADRTQNPGLVEWAKQTWDVPPT